MGSMLPGDDLLVEAGEEVMVKRLINPLPQFLMMGT